MFQSQSVACPGVSAGWVLSSSTFLRVPQGSRGSRAGFPWGPGPCPRASPKSNLNYDVNKKQSIAMQKKHCSTSLLEYVFHESQFTLVVSRKCGKLDGCVSSGSQCRLSSCALDTCLGKARQSDKQISHCGQCAWGQHPVA